MWFLQCIFLVSTQHNFVCQFISYITTKTFKHPRLFKQETDLICYVVPLWISRKQQEKENKLRKMKRVIPSFFYPISTRIENNAFSHEKQHHQDPISFSCVKNS